MAFITFRLVFNIEYRNGIELIMIYLFSKKAYFSHRCIQVSCCSYAKFCNLIILNMKNIQWNLNDLLTTLSFANLFTLTLKGC